MTLQGMVFQARVGVLDQERDIPQPIEVDLFLRVSHASGGIGQHDILDYRSAYDVVAGVFSAGHIPFLEEVAERVAAAALELPLVRSVRVTVRKPRVILPGPLAFAAVEIERHRG